MNQEPQIIAFDESIHLRRRVIAGSGGAMPVLDLCSRAKDRRPAAFPRAIAEVEIFHIGRIVDLADAADRTQFRGIEQGTTAAAIEHPGEIFAGNGVVAAYRKILRILAAPDRFAGFFAANSRRKENLRSGAEEIRYAIEGRVAAPR